MALATQLPCPAMRKRGREDVSGPLAMPWPAPSSVGTIAGSAAGRRTDLGPEEEPMNEHSPNFIDFGRWQGKALLGNWQPTVAGVVEVRDPATDALLASVGLGGAADIGRAAAIARAAQPAWAA